MAGVSKRIGAAAVLAGVVWLGGASSGGAQKPAAEGGSVKTMPSTEAPPGGSGGSGGAQQAAGPSTEIAPGVVLEVVELRRLADKGVMQLRFAVTNRTQADTTLRDHGLAWNHQLRDIAVVDFAGKRQYTIGTAARCLCSTFTNSDGGSVPAGGRREFWAWYGMPPAGPRQMAVQLADGPPILDVPLL